MARLPAITTPRTFALKDVQTLADQTRARLGLLDTAVDEAMRTARAAGGNSLTALTQQLNQLSQVVNQLALTVRDLAPTEATEAAQPTYILIEVDGAEGEPGLTIPGPIGPQGEPGPALFIPGEDGEDGAFYPPP